MSMLLPLRDENPYRRFPVVTVALIAVNVWVFFSAGISDVAAYRYGAVPCDVMSRCPAPPPQIEILLQSRPPLVSVLTSMFMHGGLLHLGGNMLFLWVFGNNVEDALGRIRFTIFYVVCGFAAAFTHIFLNPSSVIPIIGASGAVSGVLGAYLVLFPRARVVSLIPMLLFVTIVTPAWVVLTLWFAFQLISGLFSQGLSQAEEGGGVAFWAHVGGFVAGLALVFPFRIGRRRDDRMLEERFS
jgi:membrane associated rhomboid family serine protease